VQSLVDNGAIRQVTQIVDYFSKPQSNFSEGTCVAMFVSGAVPQGMAMIMKADGCIIFKAEDYMNQSAVLALTKQVQAEFQKQLVITCLEILGFSVQTVAETAGAKGEIHLEGVKQ